MYVHYHLSSDHVALLVIFPVSHKPRNGNVSTAMLSSLRFARDAGPSCTAPTWLPSPQCAYLAVHWRSVTWWPASHNTSAVCMLERPAIGECSHLHLAATLDPCGADRPLSLSVRDQLDQLDQLASPQDNQSRRSGVLLSPRHHPGTLAWGSPSPAFLPTKPRY